MRYRPSKSVLAFALAGLVGLAAGYAGEASARDGIAISGGSNGAGGHGEAHADRRRDGDGRSRGENRRRGFGGGRPDGGGKGVAGSITTMRDTFRGGRDRDYDHRDYDRNEGRQRGRGFREAERPDTIYDVSGSFISAYDGSRSGLAPNGAYDGIAIVGTGNGYGSVSTFYGAYGATAYGLEPSYPSGARIIDIESERLDRRPIGPSGIEIVQKGGPKIIRIAPGYKKPAAAREASLADTTRRNGGHPFQPWSSGWLRQCTKAYGSFDPELGTYIARDGRVRFCEID